MNQPANVPRVRAGARHHAALRVKPTLTFAIMEFLGRSDSLAFRRLLKGFKWKDVSPIWGGRTVETFQKKKSTIEQWPDFQTKMMHVDADWYFVSGHHGRIFGQEDSDYNTQKLCGFFNEFYYDGKWDEATFADPDKGEHPLEVYMDSTKDPPITPLGATENPIFVKERTKTRGAILIACNSLSYKVSRQAWNRRLPNAVVIGKTSTCPGGNKSFGPIKKVCKKAFFEDPTTIPPDELCEKLNRAYSRNHGFGVLAKGRLHFRTKRTGKWTVMDIGVDDDYPP